MCRFLGTRAMQIRTRSHEVHMTSLEASLKLRIIHGLGYHRAIEDKGCQHERPTVEPCLSDHPKLSEPSTSVTSMLNLTLIEELRSTFLAQNEFLCPVRSILDFRQPWEQFGEILVQQLRHMLPTVEKSSTWMNVLQFFLATGKTWTSGNVFFL